MCGTGHETVYESPWGTSRGLEGERSDRETRDLVSTGVEGPEGPQETRDTSGWRGPVVDLREFRYCHTGNVRNNGLQVKEILVTESLKQTKRTNKVHSRTKTDGTEVEGVTKTRNKWT